MCLLWCNPVILKDLTKMHIDDALEDNLHVEETALHAHMRAQTRAANAAKILDNPIILTTCTDDQTEKSIDKMAPLLLRAKSAPPPPRAFASTTDEITLSDNLQRTCLCPSFLMTLQLNLYYLLTTDQM